MNVVTNTKKLFSTANLVKISLLSVLSFLLMMVSHSLPFFPSFLSLDISDLPAVVGTLAMGPLAGVCIELIKNLLHFILITKTGGVGEFANFIIGSAYVIPLGLIWKHRKNNRTFILGAFVATVAMAVFAVLANGFILLPMYAAVMQTDVQTFVDMGHNALGIVNSYMTLLLFSFVPFNLIKGCVISVLGYVVYRLLRPIIVNG